MKHLCSMFNAGPGGHIVVVHVRPHEFMDEEGTAWRLYSVRRLLGGMDVLIRCVLDGVPLLHAETHLCAYGRDPRIDGLPVFELSESTQLRAAA